MDPSLALNFLCRTKMEYEEFCKMVDDINSTDPNNIIVEIKDCPSPRPESKVVVGISE